MELPSTVSSSNPSARLFVSLLDAFCRLRLFSPLSSFGPDQRLALIDTKKPPKIPIKIKMEEAGGMGKTIAATKGITASQVFHSLHFFCSILFGSS